MLVREVNDNRLPWQAGALALALLAVLLTTASYRAGGAYPHAHALIQLIHDASAGPPRHHAGDAGGRNPATVDSGSPGTAIHVIAPGALIPSTSIALPLLALRPVRGTASERIPSGHDRAPGYPPPRFGAEMPRP